jgi:hypothetical protein
LGSTGGIEIFDGRYADTETLYRLLEQAYIGSVHDDRQNSAAARWKTTIDHANEHGKFVIRSGSGF